MLWIWCNSSNPSSPNYGFIRDEAALAVIIVTDENDCSATRDMQFEVFGPQLTPEELVFWSDQDAFLPTSAACWNAGVKCKHDDTEDEWGECQPANYDVSGELTKDEGESALVAIRKYVDLLDAIGEQKRELNPGQDPLMLVIGGVPPGYAAGEAELAYRRAEGLVTRYVFGVANGCAAADESGSLLPAGEYATPPVRLRAVAERFDLDDGTRNIGSICHRDYGGLFHNLAQEVLRIHEL